VPNITLAVPEELKKKMDEFPEINWSEVARQAIWEKASQLSILRTITSRSRIKGKDALALGKKINRSLARKYKELV
jgi:hypothetical protein